MSKFIAKTDEFSDPDEVVDAVNNLGQVLESRIFCVMYLKNGRDLGIMVHPSIPMPNHRTIQERLLLVAEEELKKLGLDLIKHQRN